MKKTITDRLLARPCSRRPDHAMPALAHHSYAMFDMQEDAWRSMPR